MLLFANCLQRLITCKSQVSVSHVLPKADRYWWTLWLLYERPTNEQKPTNEGQQQFVVAVCSPVRLHHYNGMDIIVHNLLAADASTHALLWMAEAFVDMIGMAIVFEAGKHAVNYFFLARSSNQKKKSSWPYQQLAASSTFDYTRQSRQCFYSHAKHACKKVLTVPPVVLHWVFLHIMTTAKLHSMHAVCQHWCLSCRPFTLLLNYWPWTTVICMQLIMPCGQLAQWLDVSLQTGVL